MAVSVDDSLKKLTKERDRIIADLLDFEMFWTNYKMDAAIGSLQKRFAESVPLIDAFEKVQFRIMNLNAGSLNDCDQTSWDQCTENFEQMYYDLIGFVRGYLKRLRLPELLEQRGRICTALRRFEIFWLYHGEGTHRHSLQERVDRSVRLLDEFKEVQSGIMDIVAGTPEEAVYGQYDEMSSNFRNIHKLIDTIKSYLAQQISCCFQEQS